MATEKIAIETGVSTFTDAERMQYDKGHAWGVSVRYSMPVADRRAWTAKWSTGRLDPFTKGARDAMEGKDRTYG